jgi:hypothetical protein
MKWLWSCPAGVAALLLCLATAPAAVAQKNKIIDKSHDATAQEYNLLNSVKDVRGTVAAITTNSSSNTLTIVVDTSHTETVPGTGTNPTIKPNVGGARAEARDIVRVQQDMVKLQQELAKLQQAEAQLANSKNPKDAAAKRSKLQQEINKVQQDYVKLEKDYARLVAQDAANTIRDQRAFQQALAKYAKSQKNYIINEKITFELPIDDKAVVRTTSKPASTGDQSETKEKGSSAVGYPATVTDVSEGQNVHIYLTAGKSTKDKPDARPTINKIVILSSDKPK